MDASSPHIQALAGAELGAGAHTNITLASPPTLVDGAVYTISFNGSDPAGIAATTVSNTGITYDVTAPVSSATAPATNAFVNTTRVSYTLSETLGTGSITWTRTGGSARRTRLQDHLQRPDGQPRGI